MPDTFTLYICPQKEIRIQMPRLQIPASWVPDDRRAELAHFNSETDPMDFSWHERPVCRIPDRDLSDQEIRELLNSISRAFPPAKETRYVAVLDTNREPLDRVSLRWFNEGFAKNAGGEIQKYAQILVQSFQDERDRLEPLPSVQAISLALRGQRMGPKKIEGPSAPPQKSPTNVTESLEHDKAAEAETENERNYRPKKGKTLSRRKRDILRTMYELRLTDPDKQKTAARITNCIKKKLGEDALKHQFGELVKDGYLESSRDGYSLTAKGIAEAQKIKKLARG